MVEVYAISVVFTFINVILLRNIIVSEYDWDKHKRVEHGLRINRLSCILYLFLMIVPAMNAVAAIGLFVGLCIVLGVDDDVRLPNKGVFGWLSRPAGFLNKKGNG